MWNVNIEICNNVMYYYNFCAIRMTLNQITSVMVFVIVDSVVVVTWWLDSLRSVTTVSAVSVTTTSGGGFGCDLKMLYVDIEYYLILKNSSCIKFVQGCENNTRSDLHGMIFDAVHCYVRTYIWNRWYCCVVQYSWGELVSVTIYGCTVVRGRFWSYTNKQNINLWSISTRM